MWSQNHEGQTITSNVKEVRLETGELTIGICDSGDTIIFRNPWGPSATLDSRHAKAIADFLEKSDRYQTRLEIGGVLVERTAGVISLMEKRVVFPNGIVKICDADVREAIKCLREITDRPSEKIAANASTTIVATNRSFKRLRDKFKVEATLVAAILMFILGCIWWDDVRTYVDIERDGKASLHVGGWFFNGKWHGLHLFHGEWYLDNGEELIVPIEGPYSDRCLVRFEDHGRVYRVNKTDMTRTQLKVVGGEWSQSCGDGTWASIFDE